jgi:hypothetical protein
MAIMMAELYAALREAGASDDKAAKAAQEAAAYENRLARIESTQRLHTWILSTNTAALLAITGKLFLGH